MSAVRAQDLAAPAMNDGRRWMTTGRVRARAHLVDAAGAVTCKYHIAGPWSVAHDDHPRCQACAATGSDEMNGADVARVSGATYRQIDYWTRQGYLRPTTPRPGSGGNYRFTPAEVDVTVRMASLVRFGLCPEVASRVARGEVSASPLETGGGS